MSDVSQYSIQADNVAASFGIPSQIFSALIQNESGWDDTASNPNSTAYGLTQLTAGTARDMGVTDITDPIQQLQGGAKYLAQQYATFGNWPDALAAYNQGPGGVNNPAGQQYAQNVLSKAGVASPGQSQSSGGISGSISQFVSWVESGIGNVALVAIGLVVVAVALSTSSSVRNTVKKAAVV